MKNGSVTSAGSRTRELSLFVLHTYSEDGHHKKRVPLLGLPPGPLEPRGRGTADEVPHVVQKDAEHGREVQRGPPGARLRFDCRGKECMTKELNDT